MRRAFPTRIFNLQLQFGEIFVPLTAYERLQPRLLLFAFGKFEVVLRVIGPTDVPEGCVPVRLSFISEIEAGMMLANSPDSAPKSLATHEYPLGPYACEATASRWPVADLPIPRLTSGGIRYLFRKLPV